MAAPFESRRTRLAGRLGGSRADLPAFRSEFWIIDSNSRPQSRVASYSSHPESSNPEFLALREGDQVRVRQSLDELSPQLREVIVLRELEGMSYQEIATVTEIPIGTVMSRLSRGRQQLQERLESSAEGETI